MLNEVQDRLGVIADEKYEVIRPFSCNIVRTAMDDELITEMQKVFQKYSNSIDISDDEDNSYALAGNMRREFKITETTLGDKTSLLTNCLADIASQLYASSVLVEWRFKKGILTPKHIELVDRQLQNMNITVNIQHVWGNISVAGDFNPPHTHSGTVSGVGYFKLPDDIEREWLLEDHDPSAGLINFWDGRSASMSLAQFKVKPRVGDLYCFPAWLNHSVGPFRSKGERWSFSYNCEVVNLNNDLHLSDFDKAELKAERRKLLKEMENAG